MKFLNWVAASADEVRVQILSEWDEHVRSGDVTVRLGTKVEICASDESNIET